MSKTHIEETKKILITLLKERAQDVSGDGWQSVSALSRVLLELEKAFPN